MRLAAMSIVARAALTSLALGLSGPALAQSAFEIGRVPGTVNSPILTLDTERLLTESAAGRAIDDDLAEKSAALATENRRIEAELTAEEKDLSDRRAKLTSEVFKAEATAFDEKVKRIRGEQDAKLLRLQQASEQARRSILQAANPVLASIMQDTGAVAILEKGSVIAALQTIDVTDLAIERLDEAIAAESAGDAETGPDTGTADPAQE